MLRVPTALLAGFALLLAGCAGPGLFLTPEERQAREDLFRAAESGRADTAAQILASSGINPNTHGAEGVTALMYAAAFGHEGVAQRLLDAGADPNARGDVGQTPLTLAEAEGHVAVAQLLRTRGAEERPALGPAPACQVLRTPRSDTSAMGLASPATLDAALPERPVTTSPEGYAVVEQKPHVADGTESLLRDLPYPVFARRAGIEGTVVSQFVVTPSGTLADIDVLQSPHESLTRGALGALCRVSFTPATHRGEPVAVRMSLPLEYRLR